jgi:pilus assembly protein Flp/PilA
MVTRFRDTLARVAVRLAPQEGATAVEYALMVALIAIVLVAAVTLLGQATNSAYSDSTLVNTLGS